MSLLNYLSDQIEATFIEHPHQFFTEDDIHTQLALIANGLVRSKGSLYAKTRDGFVVSRVHHEYPTPFRCHMKGSEFRLITEDVFKEEKLKNPNFRARRGYIDFVVLNSDYVSSNKLRVVSGKRYRDFRESLSERQLPALDLAVEVVYFPTFDEKLHDGIMNIRVSSTIQDYKKLATLMEFTYPNNIPFCNEAAMMFFSNTIHKAKLKKKLKSLPLHKKVGFFSVLC